MSYYWILVIVATAEVALSWYQFWHAYRWKLRMILNVCRGRPVMYRTYTGPIVFGGGMSDALIVEVTVDGRLDNPGRAGIVVQFEP